MTKNTFVLLFALIVVLSTSCNNRNQSNKNIAHEPVNKNAFLGVWWWEGFRLDSSYFEFAKENGVSEIYFYTMELSSADFVFTEEISKKTAAFIAEASENNIKVYLLCGRWEWLHRGNRTFDRLMCNFNKYQTTHPENERFAGVHIDIEPKAMARDTEISLDTCFQLYWNFVVRVCEEYGRMDFDIGHWYGEQKIEYNGETVPLDQAMISVVDRVFVMAYFDTAEKMFDTSTEELEYAKSLNKSIAIGAETQGFSCLPPDLRQSQRITYFEEGKEYMYKELNKLSQLAGYDKMGISINSIKHWKQLKESEK
jgi:hypothetical protein